MGAVLGIDPGTRKVGYAIVAQDGEPAALGIEPIETFGSRLQALLQVHPVEAIALGTGTNANALERQLAAFGLPVHLIDETDTTYRARAAYFAANPPRGLRRLIPLGFQLPGRPIDDYAALLIARRFLEGPEA